MTREQDLVIELAIKRLKTVMIGSLSKVENALGYLWAQHKSQEEELTDQELYFDNVWQDIRNNILNHGNKQIRLLEEELQKLMSVSPTVKYKYRFPVIDQENEK